LLSGADRPQAAFRGRARTHHGAVSPPWQLRNLPLAALAGVARGRAAVRWRRGRPASAGSGTARARIGAVVRRAHVPRGDRRREPRDGPRGPRPRQPGAWRGGPRGPHISSGLDRAAAEALREVGGAARRAGTRTPGP